jgi:hypothetical protein
MRLLIIAADIGTFILVVNYSKFRNGKASYFLVCTQSILIELTGNLHFEGFFFVWGMYLLQQNKWQLP